MKSEEEKYSKSKLAKFMYLNGLNKSSNKITKPKDVKKIETITTDVPRINFYNIGFDMDSHKVAIRCRFVGSEMWFEKSISNDEAPKWFKMLMSFMVTGSSDFFDEDGEF